MGTAKHFLFFSNKHISGVLQTCRVDKLLPVGSGDRRRHMYMFTGWSRSDRIWSCLAPTPIGTVAVSELLRSWHDRHVIGEELLRSWSSSVESKTKILVDVGG